MKSNTFLNYIYIIDLILVSLWALFALCNSVTGSILVFPVILIRLASVFSLKQRERSAWLPIVLFVLVALSSMSFRSHTLNDFVLRPFARMYDYVVMLVAGNSTLLEGVYHFLGNHGDLVPKPSSSWDFFVICYITWLTMFPIAIYSYFIVKKRLRKAYWCWKKAIFVSILYVILSGAVIALNEYNSSIMPGVGRTWWLAVLLIPLVTNIRWQSLSSFCRKYIILTSIFVITIMAGIYMQSMGSLIAILVTAPMFYYFVGCKWGSRQTPVHSQNLYILILSGTAFWMAQYGMGISKIALLMISIWLIALVSCRIWRNSRSILTSVTFFFSR